MNYEIHITLQVSDRQKFINDCNEVGVKPIVIETQNKSEFSEQVMTSSKHSGSHYSFILSELCSKFLNKGYKILRRKVEIQPEEAVHPDHIYYESHLRLKLPKDFQYNILRRHFSLLQLIESHN